MARHTELPPVVLQHAPDAAIPHLPTELSPVPTGQPAAAPTGVTPDQHAIDAVNEHVVPLGVAPHLPDFFG
jgi:hypothetical protein